MGGFVLLYPLVNVRKTDMKKYLQCPPTKPISEYIEFCRYLPLNLKLIKDKTSKDQ